MKSWILALLLAFGAVANAGVTSNPTTDAIEDSAAGRYCYCFGSAQFHDLVYVDSSGRKNIIYTYSTRRDCEEAKARTYLCHQYSGETPEIAAYAAGDRCNQIARYCWSACDKAPYSCYRNCMVDRGCRP